MTGALIGIDDVPAGPSLRDSADVVIVGTGPAGATAARVLTAAGLDCVLVEEGPAYPAELRRADAWTAFARSWRDGSLQVASGRTFTPILQGRVVGGSSTINGAIIHRMPEAVHGQWEAEHGRFGLLALDALHRAWDRLDAELSVAPTPQEVLGGNNLLFGKGCAALGWSAAPTKRAAIGCRGSARCNQGCPDGRKQSMEVTYVPRAIEAGARLYSTCRAERVIVRDGRAAGVSGRFREPVTGRAGPELRVRARRAVVLAAGAIHTPLLLRRAGVGPRDLTGRRLACHPGTSVMPLFDEQVRLWSGASQGYECTQFLGDRMKFEVVGLPPSVAVARLPGFGRTLVDRLGCLDRMAHWGVQIRSAALGSVRPGLAGPSIRWEMTPGDVATMKLGIRRLVEIAFAAGASRVLLGIAGMPEEIRTPGDADRLLYLPDDPRLLHCICAHLFGTARIGRDRRSGVVRETGETWDLPGLYCVDASVFPSNLGVNPQHAIGGVAWLMAEGIAEGR